MTTIFPLRSVFLSLMLLAGTTLFAQDIRVDLKNMNNEYENDMNTGFKIRFKNAEADESADIGIKFGASVYVLKRNADLKNYEITFSVMKDTLIVLDSADKEIKIPASRFKITIGDTKNFTVTKPNIVTIDFSASKTEYEADVKRNLIIKFQKGATKKKKVTLSATSVREAVLLKSANLNKVSLMFKSNDGRLEIKDADGNIVQIPIKNLPITITAGEKKFKIKAVTEPAVTTTPPPAASKAEDPLIPYWAYLAKNKISFTLAEDMLVSGPGPQCCDTCTSCDDDAFLGNNRIIYNAKSGLTYFLPAGTDINSKFCGKENITGYEKNMVSGKNKIKLNAGDPLVYIVENVNPALYNLELSDSAFLVNNDATGLLQSLLLSKSESAVSLTGSTPGIQGGEDKPKADETEKMEYLRVKAGLLLVKSEMASLLENLRRSSPYMHNCIQAKKQAALKKVNEFPGTVGKYDSKKETYAEYSFIQLTDLFLNQQTEDSTLNRQIKVLYGELVAASYKIAYRYPQIPETDMVHFKLSVTAKPNSPYPSLLNVQMKTPTQTVYVKNFFKVDVSSGLYLGKMKDRTYALQPDTLRVRNQANTADSLTNIKRIVKEDDGKNEIGFASYLHLYYKYSSWFNLGATVGAGISFDKTVRPRYFTGLSLLLGSNNRLCINGGLMWGNSEDLSNQYKKTGAEYATLKDSETTLNYTTRFKHAAFISISYNIPFLKRPAEAKPASSTPPASGTGAQ